MMLALVGRAEGWKRVTDALQVLVPRGQAGGLCLLPLASNKAALRDPNGIG